MTAANLFPPRGGAERSLFTLAERMSKDFNVTIIGPGNENFERKEEGYKIISIKKPFFFKLIKSYVKINIQNLWWKKVLEKFLKENKFDLLITQGILVPSCKGKGISIKKVIFIRGLTFYTQTDLDPLEFKGKDFFKLNFLMKVQYPLIKYFQKKGRESSKEFDLIISNSEFIRKVTNAYLGKDSEIIYPPINIKEYYVEKRKPEYILFVNPIISKGVDMMYNLAKSMPDKKFLVVGKPDIYSKKDYNRLKKLKNISFEGYILNMKNIYSKTKLLVCPVRWYEPFGRTPAEAMVNGIPSIVSDRGGLPEVVKNAGDIIKNRDNIDEWIKTIKKYDNQEYYNKKSQLCKEQVKKFSLENQYKKLKKILITLK
jgi:glycosyltransferase involved in cell wall biosynthesis